MKKLLFIFICFLAIASNCKKKTAKDNLVGSWGILNYIENGVEKTSDFNLIYQGYKITFDAKGNYKEYYRNVFGIETNISGTWTLESNNLQLILVDNDPNSVNKLRTFNVLTPITDSELNVGETNKEYDLRRN